MRLPLQRQRQRQDGIHQRFALFTMSSYWLNKKYENVEAWGKIIECACLRLFLDFFAAFSFVSLSVTGDKNQKRLSPESGAAFNLWSVLVNGGDEDAQAGGVAFNLGECLAFAVEHYCISRNREHLYFPLTS